MKIKKILIFCVSLFCAISFSMHFKNDVETIKNIEHTVTDVINKGLEDSKYYLSDVFKNQLRVKPILKLQNNEEENLSNEDIIEEESMTLFSLSALDVFDNFSKDEKNALNNFADDNSNDPIIRNFCSYLNGKEKLNENELLQLVETSKEKNFSNARMVGGDSTTSTAAKVTSGVLTFAGLVAIFANTAPVLASTIAGAFATFAASIGIPIFGWIIAAAAVLLLAVILIAAWNIVSPFFAKLIDFFVEKAGRFANEVKKMFNDMGKEAYQEEINTTLEDIQGQSRSLSWTGAEVEKALNDALWKGDHTITCEELFYESGFTVFLGRYLEDPMDYTDYGCCYNGVFINMPEEKWKDWERNHIMWIFNAVFLQLCINRKCSFGLCSNPSFYYNQTNYEITPGNEAITYAKELDFIHKRGYTWKDGAAIPIFSRCPIQ